MVQLGIYIIIALAIVAIIYIAAKAMGVPIPQWLVQIVVIVIIAIVAILAIKFVANV